MPAPPASDALVQRPNTVFGGAIGIGFQKSAWGFDLRYEYDFTDAVDDGARQELGVHGRCSGSPSSNRPPCRHGPPVQSREAVCVAPRRSYLTAGESLPDPFRGD